MGVMQGGCPAPGNTGAPPQKKALSLRLVELPDVMLGLEAKVEEVVRLLPAGGGGQMVLLHGMGGIGKTTLARAVLNRLCLANPEVTCHFMEMQPGTKGSSSILAKQVELLKRFADADAGELKSPEDGRLLLADKLKGKQVLLVLDNVWGAQLQQMLPKRVMEVLGRGSVVLVTNQDGRVCNTVGTVAADRLECLQAQEALELLCWHAFGSSRPPPGEESRVRSLVARCGGVPMALEVVGRHLAGARDKSAFWAEVGAAVQHAYAHQRAGRLEADRTMFDVCRRGWDDLDGEQKETLLDIVWFLKGEEVALVESYCEYGVLERLLALGLVGQQPGAGWCGGGAEQAVAVHNSVVGFCLVGLQEPPGRRLLLEGDGGALPDHRAKVCATCDALLAFACRLACLCA
jgi:hypothetical protein